MVENPETRSRIMRAIKSRDTGPEMLVRRLAHRMGYRYRLHRKGLPGRPDLVFPSRKKVVFVHGCFWHQHDCPHGSRLPKSNQDYWLPKLARNKERDEENVAELLAQGWEVLIIWQCETKDLESLQARIWRFLEDAQYGNPPL